MIFTFVTIHRRRTKLSGASVCISPFSFAISYKAVVLDASVSESDAVTVLCKLTGACFFRLLGLLLDHAVVK